MKKFKVEVVNVKKEYGSVTVVAENKHEAIKKAREIDPKDFEESETGQSHEWRAKSSSSFYDMILSLFEGKE